MDPIERFFQRGLKLSHLRVVTMFASLGQIRLVAERMHLTQPAVSKQLADLETGLGAPVLKRVGNRLQFTPMGEALLKRAREVLLQLEQARHEVDAFCSGLSGSLAVGAVATVLPVVGPELTLQIKNRAPNVDVRFFEATSDRLFPMLADGALDLVFSRMRPPDGNAALKGEPILEDPIVVVCGAQHPLAARRSPTPADIAGMPWILPPSEAPTTVALKRWLDEHGLSLPAGCVESISMLVNERLLEAYPFLGLMPRSVALTGSQQGRIRIVKLPGASFLGTVYAFHRRAIAQPVVDAALECVVAMRDRLSASAAFATAAVGGDARSTASAARRPSVAAPARRRPSPTPRPPGGG